MTSSLAVINGQFVPAETVHLPITDPGITHGAMVTDVCRTYGGRLFRYDDHLVRFFRNCAACFIPVNCSRNVLADWAQKLIESNSPSGDVLLNTFATPTSLILRTLPLDVARYAHGVHLWPTPAHPAVSGLLPPTIKHRNRFHWFIAERLAPPGQLPVTTDERGHLLETAVGHVLMVRQGIVLAPPRETVLDGISLLVVRELCAGEGIVIQEQRLTLDADEALLCGTAFGLAAVRAIGERVYPNPGPITRRLMTAWDRIHRSSDDPQRELKP